MYQSVIKEARKEIAHKHDLAIRLIEGGVIQCDGQCVKAIKVLDPDAPCLECKMDSACSPKLAELCAEVDQISGVGHCLVLASDNH